MKRKGISKRVRFEIFKRDLFTCRYCGRRPPDVLLEVDHVIAVANGGTNDDDNLVTSCADCNRGKSAVPLGNVVPVIDELTRLAAMQEVMERAVNSKQSVEAAKVQSKVDDESVDMICDWWTAAFGDLERVEIASLRTFVRRLPLDEIRDAVDVAEGYRNRHLYSSPYKVWRYFCGVCWTKIRESDGGKSHGA